MNSKKLLKAFVLFFAIFYPYLKAKTLKLMMAKSQNEISLLLQNGQKFCQLWLN